MIRVRELAHMTIEGVQVAARWEVIEEPTWIGRLFGARPRRSIVTLCKFGQRSILRMALLPDWTLLPESHPICDAIRRQAVVDLPAVQARS